ncbi:TPA: RES domain-containing protein, partial [Burkholderia vietnamiensis]|nr:RES domain-containing protein [Burkholderia vietnamiensis]
MGAVRHACEKCEQGGSFTSQLHRNERRFDSLSGKFDVISPETSAVGPLISISLSYFQDDFRNRAMLFRLLRHLHDRIKTPIRPGEEHEYLTTQVLAEYLTAIHQPPLDAVAFGSVQHEEGKNIVIFGRALGAFHTDTGWLTYPLRVVPDTVEAVLVKRVDYSTSPVQIPGT